MNKNVFLWMSLAILSACNSISIQAPRVEQRLVSVERDADGKVLSVACIITPEDGSPSVIRPIEDCDNTIGTSTKSYKEKIVPFWENVSSALEVCLAYPKKCYYEP